MDWDLPGTTSQDLSSDNTLRPRAPSFPLQPTEQPYNVRIHDMLVD